MILKFSILIFLFQSTLLFARPKIIIFSSGFDYLPKSGLKNFEAEGNPKASLNSFSFKLNFPIVFKKDKDLIVSGFEYTKLNFNYSGISSETKLADEIQSAKLPFNYRNKVSKNWAYILGVTLGIASDFERNLNLDDFTLEGLVLFQKQRNENFNWQFGIIYSRNFGSPLILPALGFNYFKVSNEVKILLPIKAEFLQRITDRFSISFLTKVAGNRFHSHFLEKKSSIKNAQIKFSAIKSLLKFDFRVTKIFYLNSKFGYAFGRKFIVNNGNDKLSDLDLKSNYFLGCGIEVKI